MSRNVTPRPVEMARAALVAVAVATALLLSAVVSATPAGAAVREDGAAPSTGAAGFTGAASSANARFVVDGYRQLLGRTADEAGVDFHLDRLIAGGDRTRHAFTYAMLFGTEGSRQEVKRAYDDLLGRPVDAAGDAYWTAHLQGRGVLDLRVLLMASDEYRNRAGGTDSTWLEALYHDILGRPSDEAGRRYWLALTEAGVARPLIVAGIYLSDEALGRRADTYYLEALGRHPGEAERRGAVEIIRRTGERGLRARIWASDEVFERYLQAALS